MSESTILLLLHFALFAVAAPQQGAPPTAAVASFSQLSVYEGSWSVRAEHPWSGGAAGSSDHLVSHCERFDSYFTCEQSVNGKVQSLLVYTATSNPGKLNCRTITPDGLAGGRGDLTLDGNHWTYLDKPPLNLKGNWSRTENFIQDHDHIKFQEYESADEGRTWTRTNFGTEERIAANPKA